MHFFNDARWSPQSVVHNERIVCVALRHGRIFLEDGRKSKRKKNPDGLKILLSISIVFFALWLRREIFVLVTWDRARAIP